MKKCNLSEIVEAAWNLRRTPLKRATSLSFGECPRRIWKSAKEAARVLSSLMRNVQAGGTLAHPILVDTNMGALTATGNIYSVRSMVRESGLVRDRDNKT